MSAALNYARAQMMQSQYPPQYSSGYYDGSLVTPYYFSGYGGSFYNAWSPINRHCNTHGFPGVSTFQTSNGAPRSCGDSRTTSRQPIAVDAARFTPLFPTVRCPVRCALKCSGNCVSG